MSDESIGNWQEMFDSLHDPEKREEAKQATDRTRRAEEKRTDTGL